MEPRGRGNGLVGVSKLSVGNEITNDGADWVETMTPATAPTGAQNRDVQLFEPFYADHREPIARALTLVLGDAQLAADATDEAMTRAVGKWSTVSSYDNPQGWVYRVALNWARSWLRRRRSERDRPVSFGPDHASPVERNIALEDALAKLSIEHRSVVVLRFYFDWTVDQTAEALAIAPGTVKSRLARALPLLRSYLGEDAR